MRPTKDNPKIKFVKRAGLWVKTYFEWSSNGKDYIQVQEWSDDRPGTD